MYCSLPTHHYHCRQDDDGRCVLYYIGVMGVLHSLPVAHDDPDTTDTRRLSTRMSMTSLGEAPKLISKIGLVSPKSKAKVLADAGTKNEGERYSRQFFKMLRDKVCVL